MEMAGNRARAMALALMLAAASACHEEGDVQVSAVVFDGNQTFSDARLREVIVTRPSGKLPWSGKHYFNRTVLDSDVHRLSAFYSDRGYPAMKVTGTDAQFNDAKTSVRLVFTIDEGAPLLIERLDVRGIQDLPERARGRLASLPSKPGDPRDQQIVAASREQMSFMLRDHGFARARVTSREEPGSSADKVVLVFEAEPGARVAFGDVTVTGVTDISPSVVRRALAFKAGDLYRESRVIESQRRLAGLGIFDFAHIGIDPKAETITTAAPMVATVTQGKPQRWQIGVGYGTEDGPRGSVAWEHLNFLGDARHLSGEAKYSRRLSGTGLEFVEPHFLTNKFSLNARAGGWWTEEPTYTSRSIGGKLGVTFRAGGRVSNLTRIDHTVRVSYVNEALRYAITEEALADVTQADDLIALGLDPTTGSGDGRLAAIDIELERTAVDNRQAPRSGHTVSFRARYAEPNLGGTYRYSELLTEGRIYVPITARFVWANRVRAGMLRSETAADLPFSQRYFLGGSTSLRGWGRFEVAPLTEDGLATGGRAIFDLTSEVRLPVRGNIGADLFVDAGNVWDEATRARLNDLRVNVGAGLTYSSPVGVIRADFGYQLNPIPGLMINGVPETRHWRVHFGIGHAF